MTYDFSGIRLAAIKALFTRLKRFSTMSAATNMEWR